ncbi:MAG: serine/threonine protein kinase, partial [Kiritimatiellae bacterium]|nr:serine/threonine protein kinase [Kiritimatiellia bacterium]
MSDSEEQLMPTPSEFGRFILERELGHGGMGGVYLARDKVLDRPVALKVMLKSLGSDEKFMERFKVEAQAAAKLIHPSIAQIYSYDVQDGQPYIAMEMVGGGSLLKLMEVNPGSTPVTRVMRIGKQIAEALSCAADQGLVHGDVKPENILFDANGNAKLVDFGLAGMQKTEDPDEIWGTPYYIAPEKVEKKAVDFRADMYSLGATLYHALTGVAPFEGADAVEVVRARFQHDARKPSAVRADLPAAVDAIVMTMLARDPAARYPTYEALLGDIGRFLSGNLTMTQSVSVAAVAAPAVSAAAPAAATTTASGKKVLKIGGRKQIRLKPARATHAGAAAPAESAAENFDEASEAEETPSAGGNARLKRKVRRPGVEAEPVKEEMGLGKMVTLAILGVILVVGGVGGGLAWYMFSTKAEERAEKFRGYVAQQEAAREAIKQHAKNAQHFRDEFGLKRKTAFESVDKATRDYLELLDGDVREAVQAVIVPAETPELLEAIAYTNQLAEAKAAALAAANTNAAPAEAAAPAADTNAAPA